MLYIQPGLCDLLFGGVLLPAFYRHSAGLHPYLCLPPDAAEEDCIWSGQREDSARLYPTICGKEKINTMWCLCFIIVALKHNLNKSNNTSIVTAVFTCLICCTCRSTNGLTLSQLLRAWGGVNHRATTLYNLDSHVHIIYMPVFGR